MQGERVAVGREDRVELWSLATGALDCVDDLAGPGCAGMAVVDDEFVAAGPDGAEVLVRVGSPFAGALLRTDEATRLHDPATAASFAAGRMLPGSSELGAPDLRAAFVLYDGSLDVDYARRERQGATVCVTLAFVDGRPDSTTCSRAEGRQSWTARADELADMFVQVCDAARTVCGRRMRVGERMEPAMRRGR